MRGTVSGGSDAIADRREPAERENTRRQKSPAFWLGVGDFGGLRVC